MKKGIGIGIIFFGCIISAADIGRMFNGLAYGWDSILGGFILALASWIFLMESGHSLLLNTAKTAGCIAVIVAVSLFWGDSNAAPVSQNNSASFPSNSNINFYRYDDYDDIDDFDDIDVYEERICFYCNGAGTCDSCGGSGRYSYTASSTRGDRCPTCDGSGNCHGCNGRGTR